MSRTAFVEWWWVIPRCLFTCAISVSTLVATCDSAAQDLTQLSIEQLMESEVTSVSRSSQEFADSPAAVFVISAEDIRRSGVTLVPELLRLAPGLHVARISSNQWAITTRGFNGRFSNKLLVLVDGRTVYTPIFSGVFWEGLDLPLNDIERIEVIRGPGASLWGANAVNGIINIITRAALDTQGALVSVTAGDPIESVLDLRYGSNFARDLDFRVSGRYGKRGGLHGENSDVPEDDWQARRGSFRVDWRASSRDFVTAQGDTFRLDLSRNFSVPSDPGQTMNVFDQGELSGSSLQTHWEHSFSLASRMAVKLYFQREWRDDLFARYRQDTLDFDFQHDLAITENHAISWGLGHRLNREDSKPAQLFNITPAKSDQRLFSAFFQTKMDLLDDRLGLTLGTKLERNSFTGWEHQPTIKAIWKLAAQQRIWASVARAVRTPSRFEHDASTFTISEVQPQIDGPPVQVVFGGDADFDSEKVISVELGYRLWPADNFSLDLALFHNDYEDLRSSAPRADGLAAGPNGLVQSIGIVNAEEGRTYGFEVSGDWRPKSHWRLQLSYSHLQANFSIIDHFADADLFPANFGDERNPRHQVSLRSSFDLPRHFEFDFWLRYVDSIDSIQVTDAAAGIASVDDYLTLDLRAGWRPNERLELFLSGRNLFASPHLEFLKEVNTVPTLVERSVHGQVTWHF